MVTRPTYADDKLRVGVILPLTGEAGSIGQAMKNGMSLGIEKLSPRAKENLEFVYEDDQLNPKNTLSALNRLMVGRGVDLVISFTSATSNAIAPITEKKGLTLLAVAASDAKVSHGKKAAFNFWVTPDTEAKVLVPEAVRRGYKNIAIITTIHEGALSMRDGFDRQNNNTLKVVMNDEYASDVKDFRSYLTKLKTKINDVDAILSFLMPGQLGLFTKEARQLGITKDIFGAEIFEDNNEVKLSEGTLVGSWYVNADDGDGSFLKEYKQRFPNASFLTAANGNDAVLMLGQAVDKGVTKDKFAEYFKSIKDFHGALGVYSATGDNRFTLPAVVKVVTKDGFRKLND